MAPFFLVVVFGVFAGHFLLYMLHVDKGSTNSQLKSSSKFAAMSGSPVNSPHSTPLSGSKFEVKTEKGLPRHASSPSLQDRIRQILNPDNSENAHFGSGTELMTSEVKLRTEVLKILYADLLASLLTWILLAGLITLPVIFASVSNFAALDRIERSIFGAFQNVPIQWVVEVCRVCAVVGLSWLCWKNKNNHTWLADCVLLPALFNFIISLITALINKSTVQSNFWPIIAVMTIGVTASTIVFTFSLFMIYIGWTEPLA